MAGTVRVQIKIDHAFDDLKQNQPQATVTTVQTTKGGIAGVQVFGTSAAALALGSVTTPGNLYFRNHSATAVIQVGIYVSSTFHCFSELQPGQQGTIPCFPTGVYYAKSSIAGGRLWVNLHEA